MDSGQKINQHGVAVNIFGLGILITGKSGIGKSELALELVDSGHKFVVDDFVVVEKDSLGTLWLSALDFAEPFMHIRGMGFVNISKMYNSCSSIMSSSKLDIIIELTEDVELLNKQCIQPSKVQQNILGIALDKYILPVGKNRNLCLLVETLVKSHIDLKNGYDSTQDFLNNHANLLMASK